MLLRQLDSDRANGSGIVPDFIGLFLARTADKIGCDNSNAQFFDLRGVRLDRPRRHCPVSANGSRTELA